MRRAFPWIAASALWLAVAQAAGAQEDFRMHEETTFDVVVNAPLDEAEALFTPEGERGWAGENWDPHYLHPIPGRDKVGAVFTITHGSVKAVWLITQRDVEARHFQYVYYIAEIMATTIDVNFRAVEPGITQVTVKYARTSVSPEGDSHVRAMSAGDRNAAREWQTSIDEYLASKKPAIQR